MKGPDALSNAELLAIVLQKGTLNENVIDMSNRIISKFGLDKLSELSLKELESVKGVGEAKAMQIKAIFEINKRVNSGVICERVVNSSEDIAKHYIERMKGQCKPDTKEIHNEHIRRHKKEGKFTITISRPVNNLPMPSLVRTYSF